MTQPPTQRPDWSQGYRGQPQEDPAITTGCMAIVLFVGYATLTIWGMW